MTNVYVNVILYFIKHSFITNICKIQNILIQRLNFVLKAILQENAILKRSLKLLVRVPPAPINSVVKLEEPCSLRDAPPPSAFVLRWNS